MVLSATGRSHGAQVIAQNEPKQLPKRRWRLGRRVGSALLRFGGWRIEGELPAASKCVAIVAPHTSNWDFIWGVSAMLALDLDIHWFGKHTIFRWPLRRLFLLMGGTPLVRTSSKGRVAEIVETIGNAPGFIFGLAPEGTRDPVARWRSGFYHVAKGANIPIWMVYFDYKRKVVGLGPLYHPTEDKKKDMHALRSFYADKHPRQPENYIPYESETGRDQESGR
jgi:1-acyl-sn-glycerol-3-phosphate acyltransferase